ncbi:MAG: hypothetical protein AB1791_06585 [Chloroflexota bacterium]
MQKASIALLALVLLTVSLNLALAGSSRLPGSTERVSISSVGLEGDGESNDPSVSEDGRYVVFDSEASNLTLDDYNGVGDVFLRDRQLGTTIKITGWGGGGGGMISGNSCCIVFNSSDSNLVPGDTNGTIDVFVYTIQTGEMERVSVSSSGEQGDGHSHFSSISASGRYVVFLSASSNFASLAFNGWSQLFVHDRETGFTELITVNVNGEMSQGFHSYPTVSSDGRYVAFSTLASDLVANDTNGESDVFVRDREAGLMMRVSVSSSGEEGNDSSTIPAISADGRYVVFVSSADNLVEGDINDSSDTFVYDLWAGEIDLVSLSTEEEQAETSSSGTLSEDGHYVVFNSRAANLVAGDTNGRTDVFRRDRLLGITERLSVDSVGQEGNDSSSHGYVSADGRYVVFDSFSTNLVNGDTNGVEDSFFHDRPPTTLTLNYATGAPGSTFTLTGGAYPLTATATITVNGYTLGTLPTDASGGFTALLTTANADPGAYFVTAGVEPYEVTVWFVLDPNAEVRPPDGEGPIFDIPAGLAWDVALFPLMRHDES